MAGLHPPKRIHLCGSSQAAIAVMAFPSELGWMAIIGCEDVLFQLTFGYAAKAAALKAVQHGPFPSSVPADWNPLLVTRLQEYAAGQRDEFRDVCIDFGSCSPFQRRVLECCRRIPYGTTVTYGELAAVAGFERAGRAVGNCMAHNRVPILVPCHRVVRSDGCLGRYSALGGTKTKRRLLVLEGAN
jgi:methylated-DNA-[protein]-cysteine S-methyltransferase